MNKARVAAAQLLTPADAAHIEPIRVPRSRMTPQAPATPPQEPVPGIDASADVLAGMCAGVALRDLNLVDSLLAQLEDMEANEGDPDALARLYQLDHLAARLRRNAENLRVLAGHEAGDAAKVASPLVDVVRAAMSAIEQYPRVEIGRVVALAVVEYAADDLGRLLAELLDNATSHLPPTSKVTVSAHLTERGSVLLRIEDAGIGLPPERLEVLNARLSGAPALDSESIEHMGLAVVRRLAGKHGIRVRLDKRATHGTTAAVLLPASLVCEAPPTPWFSESPTMKIPRLAPAPLRVQASPPPSPRSSSESIEAGKTTHTTRTTRNGLPRRVPQSLREFAFSASTMPSPPDDSDNRERDPREGREQLMTDLGDFSDGEQAAREVRGADLRTEPRTEPRVETEQKEPDE
ncbi:MAG: sensor histidine kinase [Pseudonocardiaceae bacterium]